MTAAHMTPQAYRDAIDRLGLTQAEAAEFLDVSLRTSHGWANGQPIPKAVELVLKLMIRLKISPDDIQTKII